MKLTGIDAYKTVEIAKFFVENDTTLAEVAVKYNVHRQTILNYFNGWYMSNYEPELQAQCRQVLERNKRRTGNKSRYLQRLKQNLCN